jgi:hypothetical protein
MEQRKVSSVALSVAANNTVIVENRWLDRDVVYSGDVPELNVYIKGIEDVIVAHVVDLTVSGIGLCHPKFSEDMVGRQVSIKLSVYRDHYLYGTIQTFNTAPFAGRIENRVGIVFAVPPHKPIPRLRRFECAKNFNALAFGEHPFKYNHTVQYTIMDFSCNGMTLRGNGAWGILIPGITTSLTVLLPKMGSHDVQVNITNMRKSETGDTYSIGCVFVDPAPEFLSAISSYLLLDTHNPVTVTELRQNGFLLSQMDESLHFSYVSNKAQFEEILKLRMTAAHAEGRWVDTHDHTQFTDEFDKFSRHLFCKVGNRVVGSARVVFNDGLADRCEHKRYATIPEFLWRGGFIECSRLCTNTEFRGANIFVLVIQHLGRIVSQSNCRYVLLNCEDSLVPIYKRFGGKPLGMKFNTPYMKEKTLNLMYFDLHRIFYGKDLGPIAWFLVWKDVQAFLESRGIISISRWNRFRVFMLTHISKLFVNTFIAKTTRKLLSQRDSIMKAVRQVEMTSEGPVEKTGT